MTTITNTRAYSSGNLYQAAGEKIAAQSPLQGSAKKEQTENSPDTSGVKVSLSKAVETARLRESMGLEPTGRLRLGDFKTAAKGQRKAVTQKLAQAMEEQGIKKDQKISLSLDSKYNLTISESFSGKSNLVKALNSDTAFMASFKQLSVNQQVVDYTKNLTTRQSSMMDFMNDDSGWDGLMALANQYKEVKSAGNSLTSLLGLSLKDAPYTYVHDPNAYAAKADTTAKTP